MNLAAVRLNVRALTLWLMSLSYCVHSVRAEDRVLEFRYTPVARAQVAIWVEDADGKFVGTVALTEAVAYRGIGNRPGASQMNSGYRWPYGRREGVLPIWAHRRAAASGAKLFRRVIFQGRRIEGKAARAPEDPSDQSPDQYYCLSFQNKRSKRDQLDAVSCASPLTSDKGRYITDDDVAAHYAEPFEHMGGLSPVGEAHPLSLHSVYPPRLDVTRCTASGCADSPDVARFVSDARDVMPEIDAVTRATALGDAPQHVLFTVPPSWPPGSYIAHIEVNVEGDYNARWNDARFPTPTTPSALWDEFAVAYGYPYRGQPSVVFSVPFEIGAGIGEEFATGVPAGRSSWECWSEDYGTLEKASLETDDELMGLSDNGGSGVDRLHRDAHGARFVVAVRDSRTAPPVPTIGAVQDLQLGLHPDPLHSHDWATMQFRAPRSEHPLFTYEVRTATTPITDEVSFIRDARPARTATDDPEGATALSPPADAPTGALIATTLGDLLPETHYYVAVRATNDLNEHGPLAVAEVTTTQRSFATVSPCFIATAAYGTPLAGEIGVLRHLRDRYLATNAPGRWLIAAYYRIGPHVAGVIERHERLRAYTRSLLSLLVASIPH
jgi:hypothetical protein